MVEFSVNLALHSRRSFVTRAVSLNSQNQVLEDDHAYSTTNDLQQQMFVVCNNPVYGTVCECSHQQPVLQEDHAYSTIDDIQQQTSGHPAQGTALGKAASSNWKSMFSPMSAGQCLSYLDQSG